jgi:hypothetical protein
MDPNESIELSSFITADTNADQAPAVGQGTTTAGHADLTDDEAEGQGDRGIGDDADDSDEWGEATEKDADKTEEDEDDKDDEENPADERESWRKGRLNKVKEQRDEARKLATQREADAATARREADEVKARLAVYEAGGTPETRPQQAPPSDGLPDMPSIQRYVAENDPTCIALAKQVEAIKAKADTFADAGSYLEALSEAQTEYKAELRDKSREVRQHLESQRKGAASSQEAYATGLVKNYETAISASTIPKIQVYAKRLVENAGSLHPAIREAILTHEHKDAATAAITSNRAAFDWLVQASKDAGNGPLHPRAVAYVGELIATYRGNTAGTPPAQGKSALGAPPSSRPSEKPPAKALPRTIRSRSTGSAQSDDVDPFQHARNVLNGSVQDPELRRGR